MVWRLLLASVATALVVLAASSFQPDSTLSMVASAPRSPSHTATVSEMVPTQGWPWTFFNDGGSQLQRSEPPREPRPREPGEEGYEARRRLSTSGTFRTVCVRLCDGFYWPISHATTRDRFSRDAKQCEQGRPSRSRLFVHRTSDTEPIAMKDLDGQPYEKLENAFRHQREYVSDCTCRGNPWDEAALAAIAPMRKPRRQTRRRRLPPWRNRRSTSRRSANAVPVGRRDGLAAVRATAPGTRTERSAL